MQSDDPPFLIVGTEVSAKFKGAFCEAKVKKIVKSVKCKVLLKEAPFGSVTVEDTSIRGKLDVNQLVEVVQIKQVHKGVIQSIKDCSSYTVVFNDGDERVLRRTQVCLKGAKHFDSAANLDTMPLYNPETFVNSMLGRSSKKKILKRKAGSPTSETGSDDETDPSEILLPPSSSTAQTRQNSISSVSNSSPTPSRRSLRRSASVTPLKGIASTRSATRAIAALKYGDNVSVSSKSPTPSLNVPRSSSVLAVLPCASSRYLPSTKDSDSEKEDEETAPKAKRKTETNILEDVESVKKIEPVQSVKKQKHRLNSEKETSVEENCESTRPSTSKKRDLVSEAKSNLLKKDPTGTNLSKEGKLKHPKPEMSEDGVKKKKSREYIAMGGGLSSSSSWNSNLHHKASSTEETEDDKKFPPGTAVLINEFVSKTSNAIPEFPLKTGGRVQLGLVVSIKDFKNQTSTHRPPPPIIGKRQIPVRSFQNGRYHVTQVEKLSFFDPIAFRKLADSSSTSLKIAFERANLYYTKKELPQSWEMKGSSFSKDSTNQDKKEASKVLKKRSTSESGATSSSEEEEDDDYNERRDRFVAHFYNFQDQSGNPMNRIPILGGKEIDLYRFYDVVHNLGGHKRVTQESRWRKVLSKLKLEGCAGATPLTVKNAYVRYFEKFEAFMKHLGYSSLNGGTSTSGAATARSSRAIRAPYTDKKSGEKRKGKIQKDVKEDEGGKPKHQRSTSKDSSIEPPHAKVARMSSSTEPYSAVDEPIQPSTTTVESEGKPEVVKQELKRDAQMDKEDKLMPPSTSSRIRDEKSLLNKLKEKKSKTVLLKRESRDSDNALTSSDEETVKRLHRRRGSSTKEDRVKSPLGHQAVEEQDVGYTNANIFTRFYQGQKVHARHHLRFYDARVITVKQPSLPDIAKSLMNAYELSKLTHPNFPGLENIALQNMGMEMKDVLKNMVNATKCFVHYLGWNSRYDEWLMLHKIRVDEKDEKASTKALESLIPRDLPPQIFALAMDWCTSAEGIPSLLSKHAYASDQQRPRRLSSSVTSSSNTLHPPKASTSHEAMLFQSKSLTAKSQAPVFTYQSPLSSPAAACKPTSSSMDHHSPLQRNSSYTQNLGSKSHHTSGSQELSVKTQMSANTATTMHSPVKFTIPHLQRPSESSSSCSSSVHSGVEHYYQGNDYQQLVSSSTSHCSPKQWNQAQSQHQQHPMTVNLSAGVYSAPPLPPITVPLAPPALHTSQPSSSCEPTIITSLPSSVTISRGIRSPPAPASVALSATSMAQLSCIVSAAGQYESGGSVAPYSVVIKPPEMTSLLPPPPLPPSFSPSPSIEEVANLAEISAQEPCSMANKIVSCKAVASCSWALSKDGQIKHQMVDLKEVVLEKKFRKRGKAMKSPSPGKMQNLAMLASASGLGSAADEAMMAMKSPLTVSSCGAVEDSDENASTQPSETPLNEEDESTSTDAKSTVSSSKILGSSPPPRSRSVATCVSKKQASHASTANTYKTTAQQTNQSLATDPPVLMHRTATPRSRRRSKSPEDGNSSGEDAYEEQVSHTDSSHAVRQRVVHRMEAEHQFSSYSFVGLPELDGLLDTSTEDCNANNIKVMEDRMQILRDIYQTYRAKFTRLERRHKASVAKKKQQQKEARESNNSSKTLGSAKEASEPHKSFIESTSTIIN